MRPGAVCAGPSATLLSQHRLTAGTPCATHQLHSECEEPQVIHSTCHDWAVEFTVNATAPAKTVAFSQWAACKQPNDQLMQPHPVCEGA
jgi:hypothetical protein